VKNGREFEEYFSSILGLGVLFALLLLAVVVTPFFFIGVAIYVVGRLYLESPARLERVARAETELLYHHALRGQVVLGPDEIDDLLSQAWPPDTPFQTKIELLAIGRALFADEGLSPEIPPVPALCNTVEGARYRDLLARLGQARTDRVMVTTALTQIGDSLAVVARAVPNLDGDVMVSVSQFLEPLGPSIESIIAPFYHDSGYIHFKALRARLDQNLERTHRTSPVFPRDYKGPDAIETYLAGTRLKSLFAVKTPFAIPEAARFEHVHIVAGSGHGKTQTLQYFVASDLPDIARGDKSVVVIDSQGDLIRTILAAKHLPPERIVLIDPEDLAFPVALNLFSVGQERLAGYNAVDQERLTNSILELYDFVLGSLLGSGMTAKQNVVFRYVTRLMLHIPNATIHTLRELMEPGGSQKYQTAIATLDPTARKFFAAEFDGKEFTNTKGQVLRRLYGILENRTFERMFTHPTSRFDMFAEMNAGKLILINTAKSLLKEQGTEVFGRFFIALIAQAAQERATLTDRERLPCLVYVDEAQDYFDENVGIILSQARKYRVGMTLAHQFLGQLTSSLQEGVEANTAVKLAGGVSLRDARALSGQMGADAEMIARQPKGTFAAFIRGVTERAVPISFPFFVLEKAPKTTAEERAAIVAHSRATYAHAWEEAATATTAEASPTPENADAPSPPERPDPLSPSREL
jgi:hypothetical protein